MTTTTIARRKTRGMYPKSPAMQQSSGVNARKPQPLPEYLTLEQVEALLQCAPNPQARLLMLEQWRAGLRVSEALALEVADLTLDSDRPTLRVRSGKGGKSRIVPVHPELAGAFRSALSYGSVRRGRIIEAHRSTAWRWVQSAMERAIELGAIPPGKRIGTHTLRHSYARHLLLNGIPLNFLSRWLGHSSIQTTLIYLELVPDPSGSLERVP